MAEGQTARGGAVKREPWRVNRQLFTVHYSLFTVFFCILTPPRLVLSDLCDYSCGVEGLARGVLTSVSRRLKKQDSSSDDKKDATSSFAEGYSITSMIKRVNSLTFALSVRVVAIPSL
jgi:hypothetical protein